MSETNKSGDYGKAVEHVAIAAPLPELPYLPSVPENYRPKIGVIGCGGITLEHMKGYRLDGLDVAMFSDLSLSRAEKRRDEFYPNAAVTTDYREVLARPDIEVVDIATQPVDRPTLIEAALKAGKHVLSQKPFVLDLRVGERLSAIAKENGVKLAVNQNGRWAPYLSYLRQAVAAGLLGEISSIEMNLAWDHTWIKGTPFETIEHVVLYDFAIHWFDICACLMGEKEAKSVYSVVTHAAEQTVVPPMSTATIIEYPGASASLCFHAHTKFANGEFLRVTGSRGVFTGSGYICAIKEVELFTEGRQARGRLEGEWFPQGMRGTMGELLHAIVEKREPSNSAESSMKGLALCFAAIESARTGLPQKPGTILEAGPGCITTNTSVMPKIC